MKDITELLEQPDATIAVVGATDDPSKYGNVIYRDLKKKGFVVHPVNPNRSQVDGGSNISPARRPPRNANHRQYRGAA